MLVDQVDTLVNFSVSSLYVITISHPERFFHVCRKYAVKIYAVSIGTVVITWNGFEIRRCHMARGTERRKIKKDKAIQ